MRGLAFAYPADFDPAWSGNVPEFACAANSVSLMMPYVEPYVAKSVHAALPHIEDEVLRREAASFVRQELSHRVQHRQFNNLLAERCRGIRVLEQLMRMVFERLGKRRSNASHLAFAAGTEGVAYGVARWAAAHRRELPATAQPEIANLFVWHLAEEVEHKSVAFDVFQAVDGSRRRYIWGMILGFSVLALFTVVGTTVQLWQQRRLFRPTTYLRLTRWTITFLFELLPTMAASSLRGHHPRDLADPPFLVNFLRELDDRTAG